MTCASIQSRHLCKLDEKLLFHPQFRQRQLKTFKLAGGIDVALDEKAFRDPNRLPQRAGFRRQLDSFAQLRALECFGLQHQKLIKNLDIQSGYLCHI